mgnify:CR=1 FL=1
MGAIWFGDSADYGGIRGSRIGAMLALWRLGISRTTHAGGHFGLTIVLEIKKTADLA